MTHRFLPKPHNFNGVLTYINSFGENTFYNFIDIIGNNVIQETYGTLTEIFPPRNTKHLVIYAVNASYTFHFKNFYVNTTGYSIKSDSSTTRYIKRWKLEASINDTNWKELHYMRDCADCYINTERYFKISGVYNMFRVTKLLNNSDSSLSFDLYGFEIFGQVCNPIGCNILKSPTQFQPNQTTRIFPSIFLFVFFFLK